VRRCCAAPRHCQWCAWPRPACAGAASSAAPHATHPAPAPTCPCLPCHLPCSYPQEFCAWRDRVVQARQQRRGRGAQQQVRRAAAPHTWPSCHLRPSACSTPCSPLPPLFWSGAPCCPAATGCGGSLRALCRLQDGASRSSQEGDRAATDWLLPESAEHMAVSRLRGWARVRCGGSGSLLGRGREAPPPAAQGRAWPGATLGAACPPGGGGGHVPGSWVGGSGPVRPLALKACPAVDPWCAGARGGGCRVHTQPAQGGLGRGGGAPAAWRSACCAHVSDASTHQAPWRPPGAPLPCAPPTRPPAGPQFVWHRINNRLPISYSVILDGTRSLQVCARGGGRAEGRARDPGRRSLRARLHPPAARARPGASEPGWISGS